MTHEIVFGPEEITYVSIICPGCKSEAIVPVASSMEVPQCCDKSANHKLLQICLVQLRELRKKNANMRFRVAGKHGLFDERL